MASSLAGRVAVVTGAARGIGDAIAERLLADGARVFSLDKVAAEEPRKDVVYLEADVTDPASVAASLQGDRCAGGPDRHSRQQRRHPARRPCGQDFVRRLLGGRRDPSQRVLPLRVRSRAAHGGARQGRRDRQHRIDRGVCRAAGTRRLLRGKGWHSRPHPGAGARSRLRRHSRQCGRAGLHPDQVDRSGTGGRIVAGGLDGGARADEAPRRARRKSPMPCAISPATKPPT